MLRSCAACSARLSSHHGRLAFACSSLIAAFTLGGCAGDSPASPVAPPAPPAPSAGGVDAPDDLRSAGAISVTDDDRILVELAPGDTTPGNPFDLNGKSLVFTPDGSGGYSRSVSPVEWETDLGEEITEPGATALIPFGNFRFEFAGQQWDSFHLSTRGLLTFGAPHPETYWETQRYDTMRELAEALSGRPIISPLYKPLIGRYGVGARYVSHRPTQVVVTWFVVEPYFYAGDLPPEEPTRFQAVLGADGSIRFNYLDVAFADGVVGLFPGTNPVKGDLIVSLPDSRDPAVPGHLDLLEVTVHESGGVDRVIVEFTVRDAIPEPDAGVSITYYLWFDTDEPYWRYWSLAEEDFRLSVRLEAGGATTEGGRLLPRDADDRISLVADLSNISASVVASTSQDGASGWAGGDSTSPREFVFAAAPMDLSQPDDRFSDLHREVFHFRSRPDLSTIACRVVEELGDAFDLFVFHSEFRLDVQESLSHWRPYRQNVHVRGTGLPRGDAAQCGEGRLKGHWRIPNWVKGPAVWSKRRLDSDEPIGPFDVGLYHFAHELGHTWLALAEYDRNGAPTQLADDYGHWLRELHAPAAFPWREETSCPRSIMGGSYWLDHGDGTFTRAVACYGVSGGGFSWLDLYLMGLAGAEEVPNLFLLRNRREIEEFRYSGDPETVSIEQVVAALGLREPTPAGSQKDFNAGFVYLLDPGQPPSPDLLERHRQFRDIAVEHWARITGGRSRVTTEIPAQSRSAAPSR